MTTFKHTFDPASSAPPGTTANLSLLPVEIENAGLLEVLQTPGVAMGTWSILGALLDPGTSEFVFKEQLGRAREVKVAVSGLFGRFVARAYAMKYLGYTHFSHIEYPPMSLSGPINAVVDRVPGKKGDMPDWVAWSASAGHAIIEAKGSHDPAGPGPALERAYNQAERAYITVHGRRARLKRYAIATRWGFANGPFHDPMLWVKDPDDQGDNVSQDDHDNAGLGIVRRHIAGLLKPLGYPELANALRRLTSADSEVIADGVRGFALALLDQAEVRSIVGPDGVGGEDLIGGFIAKGGPLGRDVRVDRARQDLLVELDLRPTFVGIERSAIRAAIEGDLPKIGALAKDGAGAAGDVDGARRDRSSTWVVRLEADGNRVDQA